MVEFITEWYQWLDSLDNLWNWVGAVSVFTFIGSMAVLPWLVSRIPRDYFLPTAKQRRKKQHLGIVVMLIIVKNSIGLIMLVMGVLMLVLPGQGLLTILVAIILLDFPGKFRLEQWLISRPGVLKAINWLREKGGHKPLLVPQEI